jgi:nucleoside triphosphate diphosphatase
MVASDGVSTLLELMAALRTPGSGCPWDLEQSFRSIAPYTIEEAYEVADAIERGNLEDLRDELGDLLLQVVFHSRMAQEQGAFHFRDVVEAITSKLLRRHPHVFGATGPLAKADVTALWDRIKAEEQAERVARRSPDVAEANRTQVLAGVPVGLPALTRALKLQTRAAKVGFDWNDARAVITKIREETDEVDAAIAAEPADRIADEIGDLLFAVTNLARHVGTDPETALRRANTKFERRFAAIEAALRARGKTPSTASLSEMDALWDAAKTKEAGQNP